jgi:NAD+ kinase
MIVKKIHFTFDKSKKSQNLKIIILKKYNNYSASKADLIIVAGGDGYMLKNLKKYYKYEKPFYGINCGTFGFLMNRLSHTNLYKKIEKATETIINPLELTTVEKKNIKKKIIAINEVSLFRQSRQTVSLSLKIGKKTMIKKLIGDGILVSTPAGSTAYNLSVHGPILSLNSKKIAVTPISPFRPRRLKGKAVSDKSIIVIKNLNPIKRPVAAVADNYEIRNIKLLTIKVNKSIKIKLLYDKGRTLTKRIKIEQLRKV